MQRDLSWDKEEWAAPLSTALDGLSAEQAAWLPFGGGNTIRETLRHLNYYNERILYRLAEGKVKAQDAASNEETFVGGGEAGDEDGWRAEVERTRTIAEQLRQAIAGLREEDLSQPYGESTLGEVLASWMLHDSHHTGEIVLIRKMQGSWRGKARPE